MAGILRKRKHVRSLVTDNSDEDEGRNNSPTFFGKLNDKIKAEYFDRSPSRDGSPRKSDAGNLFTSLNIGAKKVRNPSLKSIKTEKRVSFIGDTFERN